MATLVRRSLKIYPRFAQRLTAFRACQNAAQIKTSNMAHTQTKYDRWLLMSAVCLERPPQLSPLQTEFEKKIEQMFDTMDMELSILSDHELKHIQDLQKLKNPDPEEFDEDVDEEDEENRKLSAADLEDNWELELKKFSFTSRLTDADRNNDFQSVNRKLDKKLVLVVKQLLGKTEKWVLPSGARMEGDSMRKTAEKALSECCGDLVESRFIGNAPCGFYQQIFPKPVKEREKCDGAKVFFFKAEYNEGELDLGDNVKDYKWLTLEEMKDIMEPAYFKCCKQFLVETESDLLLKKKRK